jgi:hypothetical protein
MQNFCPSLIVVDFNFSYFLHSHSYVRISVKTFFAMHILLQCLK